MKVHNMNYTCVITDQYTNYMQDMDIHVYATNQYMC